VPATYQAIAEAYRPRLASWEETVVESTNYGAGGIILAAVGLTPQPRFMIYLVSQHSELMRSRLEARCAAAGKKFNASYWTPRCLEYEARQRLPALISRMAPAWAEVVAVEMDREFLAQRAIVDAIDNGFSLTFKFRVRYTFVCATQLNCSKEEERGDNPDAQDRATTAFQAGQAGKESVEGPEDAGQDGAWYQARTGGEEAGGSGNGRRLSLAPPWRRTAAVALPSTGVGGATARPAPHKVRIVYFECSTHPDALAY